MDAKWDITTALRSWKRRAVKRVRLEYYAWAGPLPRPEKWVFIVGCYNSGTTLLHKLLASHSATGSMHVEGHYCTTELLIPKEVGLTRLWAIQPERFRLDETSRPAISVERLKRQWGAAFNDPTKPVLLEKTPVNAARMRWLQEHFENAHFIAIVRNGFAVAEGIRRKTGHPLALAATQWARSNEIMLADLGAVRRHKLIRYEALSEAPDAVLRDVLDFLGLDPGGLNVTDRTWSIHRDMSEIRNMNSRSFGSLTLPERQEVRSVAAEMLDRLGYDCQ